MGTVGDFSIHLYIIYVPPPLKKYKECSCALSSINIPKNIWCGLILKDDQNQEVTRSFCQVKLFLKTHGAYTLQENRAPTLHPRIISLCVIKRCRKYTWFSTSSNKTMYWIYKHFESLASDKQSIVRINQYMCFPKYCNPIEISGICFFEYTLLWLEHCSLTKNYW